MKRVFLPITIVLFSSLLSAQQDSAANRRPPTTAQVMKFFEVMHIHEQMQSMLQTQQKQFNSMMKDMFTKQLPNATPEQKVQFERLTSTAMNDLITNYPIDDVLRDMVPVYQAHLTESDLDEVIAFYSSATGQRLLKEMPTMTAEGMRVSYSRLQPEIEKLMKNMSDNIEQMMGEAGKNQVTTKPNEEGK